MTCRVLLAATLLCACGGDGDGGKFPIVAGGGGSGNSFVVDAPTALDTSNNITGRVCLLADARTPATCASTGADGFTVAIGSQTATTAADGAFTITRPTGSNLQWSVTGTGIETSILKFSTSATTVTIPAIDTVLYADMLAAMLAVIATGDGAIIAQLTRNGATVSGATAIATPQPTSDVYYDGTSAVDWELDATNTFGVVWIPSIAPGTAALSVDSGAVSTTDITGIPIVSDAITFVFSEVL